jgi:hypothetical protein
VERGSESQLFENVFRALRPRTPVPVVKVIHKQFATARSHATLTPGSLTITLSDAYSIAPPQVQEAHAWVLLSKLFRKPVPRIYSERCRRYFLRKDVIQQLESMKRERGRKLLLPPRGVVYDLANLFEELNLQYFFGLMARPEVGWGPKRGRTILGHYDPAHHVIVISKLLDSSAVPKYVVEYVMFHEMLHLRHAVTTSNGRRQVHTKEFKREERNFVLYEKAVEWLERNWNYRDCGD